MLFGGVCMCSMLGIPMMKPCIKDWTRAGYLPCSPASSSVRRHASGLYGVSGLVRLRQRTVACPVAVFAAAGALVYVPRAFDVTSPHPLPIEADRDAVLVDDLP